MSVFIIIIHVLVCIALIFVVLLQTGKGADMGAAFGGGGSQTLFGSTGASSFLSKMTTGAAIVFMLTSLTLAYVSSKRVGRSTIMPEAGTAPMTQEAADQALPGAGSEAPVAPDMPLESSETAPEPGSAVPPPAESGGEAVPAAPADEG